MDILGWIYWVFLLVAVFGQFVVALLLISTLVRAALSQSSRALPKG